MNRKIVAVALAVLMSASLVSIASADDSAADDLSNSTTVNIPAFHIDSGTESINLILNDTAYQNYTITWRAATWNSNEGSTGQFGTGVRCDPTDSDGGNIAGSGLAVSSPTIAVSKHTTDAGKYTLTVSNATGVAYVAVKAQITVYLNESPTSSHVDLDPVYYTLSINTTTPSTETLATPNDKTFTYGVSVSAGQDTNQGTLTFLSGTEVETPTTLTDYTWYAIGLPKGLSMSADTGIITGVPLKTTDTDVKNNVTIIAKNNAGEYKATMTVKVTDESSSGTGVTLKVSATSGATQMGGTDSYYTQQGREVTFSVTATGGLGSATYTVINDNGERTGATAVSESQFKVTPNGTGAFVIEVTYSGQTYPVKLYVLAQPGSVTADIVVSGGGA